MGTMNDLANHLQNTLSSDREERRKAELFLKSVELQPSYSLCLLRILQDESLKLPTRLAAAVTFKNFVKTFWPCAPGDPNKISDEDRSGVRSQLIGVLLSVSGNVQHQLSESITTIWREDFPSKWPNIIPELVQRMAYQGADLSMVQGVLYTAYSLFKCYRHECASQELFKEMKLVIGQFGSPLLGLAKNLLFMLDKSQAVANINRLQSIFSCLLLVCKIFYCLNCQDLPEFFEDTIGDWMTFFLGLLQFNFEDVQAMLNPNTNPEEIELVIDQTKSQICDNAGLYASKYEPEFAPYLPSLVTAVWEMLLRTSEQTKFDMLIGNAIQFLSTVISKPQHRCLFENAETLQKLCEKVILPNMNFRAQDEELFSENPEEYMNLDLDGSHVLTRRKATCHLVRVLCEAFEGQVVANFSTYINHLLLEYVNMPNGSGWKSKNIALLLVTFVAARGKTERHGVTTSTELVNLTEFFDKHVLPELRDPNVNHLPVIKSDCLRYAITFRGLLQPSSLVNLLNLMPSLLSASSPVVHSYAAVLTDKFLSMKRSDSHSEPLILKDQIENPQLLIEKLLTLLQMSDSENVFVMRALLRTCCCLQERSLQFMNYIVSTLLTCLNQVIKNPSKPDYNHYLFECMCVCIRLTCGMDAASVAHFEAALLPVFQEIFQQDIVEFVPYAFQLLSVMLEQYPFSSSVLVNSGHTSTVNGVTKDDSHHSLHPPPPYSALLSKLLVPSLWDPVNNVAPLVRLMQSYLLHNLDELLGISKLLPILGVFQKLVTSSANDLHSFNLLLTLVLATPKDVMSAYLRQVFMVIFKRLQSCKTERFMKSFASFIAHFVIIYSPNALIELVDGIQSYLFARVLEKVLLPHVEAIITNPILCVSGGGRYLDSSGVSIPSACVHWRQASIGLIKLISEADAIYPPLAVYHGSWALLVARIIVGLAAGPGNGGDAAIQIALSQPINSAQTGVSNDERFIEIAPKSSATSTYCQLNFAKQRLPDLCKDVSDPRSYLVQSLQRIYYLHPDTLASELNGQLHPEQAVILQSYSQLTPPHTA